MEQVGSNKTSSGKRRINGDVRGEKRVNSVNGGVETRVICQGEGSWPPGRREPEGGRSTGGFQLEE